MASAPNSEGPQGFLNSCLLGGDTELEKRARRVKRRALLVSVLLQILIVAALVLVPLLSKGENIAGHVVLYPTVPYSRGGGHPHAEHTRRLQSNQQAICRFCPPPSIPARIITRDSTRAEEPSEPNLPDIPGMPTGVREGGPAGIFDRGGRIGKEIEKPRETEVITRRIRVTTLEPAMLLHRVEPEYPPLARQLRHEGRVELHAIIATDGSIQSLEVVSGDPLLIHSALDAVRQWHYRPTILNGQAVEVDTYITVVYTLSR